MQTNNISAVVNAYKTGNFVVLDTETTGLDRTAELCQIALIDPNGVALIDTLIQPTRPIPAGATAIHGITDAHVATAPRWADIKPLLLETITDRYVLVYNAIYDRRILHQTDTSNDLPTTDYHAGTNWVCVMEAFARHFGQWNPRYSSFTYKSLDDACRSFGIHNDNAHSALADCRAALAVTIKLASLYG